MQKIVKKIEIFFKIYVSDFIQFFYESQKNLRFFRKKSAKGVDNHMRVCHSLASSLNVFEKRFSPL